MNFVWATEPDSYLEPRVGPTGPAALEPVTVLDVFRSVVEKHGARPALLFKRPVGVFSLKCK